MMSVLDSCIARTAFAPISSQTLFGTMTEDIVLRDQIINNVGALTSFLLMPFLCISHENLTRYLPSKLPQIIIYQQLTYC